MTMYKNARYIQSYNITTGIKIDINGMTSFVPLDPANTDYQRIMQLVDSGQLVIDPAE